MTRGTAKDVATVVAVAGSLVGRTRLQKTVSLLEMAGLGYGFTFDYHRFGPFSEDLVVSTDRAVALNYVAEEERRANWGGRYSVFSAPHRANSDNATRDALINLAREADAVSLELAVTAAFLAREGAINPWAEVEVRKPEKVSDGRLDKAKTLYQKFRQIPDLPNPLPAI